MVPEIEAISTQTLVELEAAHRAAGDPDRASRAPDHGSRGIRRLAAETLGLRTSAPPFADAREDYRAAVAETRPAVRGEAVISSSGHGQSLVRDEADIDRAWDYAQTGGHAPARAAPSSRASSTSGEITLLTMRHAGGTSF